MHERPQDKASTLGTSTTSAATDNLPHHQMGQTHGQIMSRCKYNERRTTFARARYKCSAMNDMSVQVLFESPKCASALLTNEQVDVQKDEKQIFTRKLVTLTRHWPKHNHLGYRAEPNGHHCEQPQIHHNRPTHRTLLETNKWDCQNPEA